MVPHLTTGQGSGVWGGRVSPRTHPSGPLGTFLALLVAPLVYVSGNLNFGLGLVRPTEDVDSIFTRETLNLLWVPTEAWGGGIQTRRPVRHTPQSGCTDRRKTGPRFTGYRTPGLGCVRVLRDVSTVRPPWVPLSFGGRSLQRAEPLS